MNHENIIHTYEVLTEDENNIWERILEFTASLEKDSKGLRKINQLKMAVCHSLVNLETELRKEAGIEDTADNTDSDSN